MEHNSQKGQIFFGKMKSKIITISFIPLRLFICGLEVEHPIASILIKQKKTAFVVLYLN